MNTCTYCNFNTSNGNTILDLKACEECISNAMKSKEQWRFNYLKVAQEVKSNEYESTT